MGDLTACYLGVEIGGSKLQVVAGDARGRIARRWRAAVDRDRGGAGICNQLRAGLAEIAAGLNPIAVGVGFGGPIDWRTGRIARSHQIQGWEGFELNPWLQQVTGLPITSENDSNVAALAESILGAGAGAQTVFYFNLGSGVGGGLVIDSRIHHGLPPGEAEFGHLRLDKAGATVESRCSGWAVDRRIADIAAEHPAGALAEAIRRTGAPSTHLAEALARGDAPARAILDELADDLALALSHVVHLIHPQVLVMGGGLSLIGQPLRDAIAEALERYVMEAFRPAPALRLAHLGEDAVPAGALLLAATQARRAGSMTGSPDQI